MALMRPHASLTKRSMEIPRSSKDFNNSAEPRLQRLSLCEVARASKLNALTNLTKDQSAEIKIAVFN